MFSKEYIPQGTRFGPLQGEIYTKDNVPKQANRKYFWRVREYTRGLELSVVGKHSLRTEKEIGKFETTGSKSSTLIPEKPIGFPDAEVHVVTSKAKTLCCTGVLVKTFEEVFFFFSAGAQVEA